MALIKEVRGFTPKFGSRCFLSETSVIIGDVIIGDDCSIWFGAVLRGDVNSIRIGNRVNIQDNAVIHTTFQKSITTIEDDVSIAHNATVHGATLKKGCLVGIGAVVLDHAVIGEGAIIAANSVVLNHTVVEPGSIYAGAPAKLVKYMEKDQAAEINIRIAKNYLTYKDWYKE